LEAAGNVILSMSVWRRPFWPDAVKDPPTAQHETDRTQATDPRRLSNVTFGVGSTDQLWPSQASMKAWGWKEALPPAALDVPEAPAAQQVEASRQVIPLRVLAVWPDGLALGVADQVDPSQRSIKVVSALPELSEVVPVAQQSVLDTHVVLVR
jgi:hypothetical protein